MRPGPLLSTLRGVAALAWLAAPLPPALLYLRSPAAHLPLGELVLRTLGIAAFAYFCLEFVITARIRPLERLFGQDILLRRHMVLALGALGLAALHSGAEFEGGGGDVQAWFGAASMAVIGYGMLFAALFFGDFLLRFLPLLKPLRDGAARLARLSHGRCRLLHQVMLPGLALALIHILLLPGQGLGPFKACTAAYFALAAAAYLRHTLRRTGDRPRQAYSVAQARRESDSVVTLELAPQAGRAIRFLPGQFLYLRPLSGALPGEEHPFSISCGPGRDTVSITVKNLGDFTARMGEARPGDRMALDGPYGRFSYRCAQRRGPLALVAGGIGITPMLSMLHGLAEEDPGRSVTLIWSVRTEDELVRRAELEALGGRLEDFAFVPVFSRGTAQGARTGRVDRALLAGVLEERGLLSQGRMATDATFFVCGPPAMARTAVRALRDLGASPARIHAERFAF